MRLIERQMIDAILQGKDWCKDNTKVVQFYNDKDYPVITSVFLHGNKIAEIDATTVEIYDGGYQSNTTKSRLNALINGLCNPEVYGVFQKNYEWFIYDNGETVEFEHGYTLERV
jgi:hypothetical protein